MFVSNLSSMCFIHLIVMLMLMFVPTAKSNILFDSLARSAKFVSKTVERILDVPRSMAPPLCALKTVKSH